MFAFFVLSSSPGLDIKQFGIGLGAGIIFDATAIRALLVPALMRLMGRWNWWLPPRCVDGWCSPWLRPGRAPDQAVSIKPEAHEVDAIRLLITTSPRRKSVAFLIHRGRVYRPCGEVSRLAGAVGSDFRNMLTGDVSISLRHLRSLG